MPLSIFVWYIKPANVNCIKTIMCHIYWRYIVEARVTRNHHSSNMIISRLMQFHLQICAINHFTLPKAIVIWVSPCDRWTCFSGILARYYFDLFPVKPYWSSTSDRRVECISEQTILQLCDFDWWYLWGQRKFKHVFSVLNTRVNWYITC